MIDRASDHPEPHSERRAQQRLPIRGVAQLSVKRRKVTAEAVDISSHGLCLTLQQPLEVGSSYRLDVAIEGTRERRTTVVARVCFCLRDNNGFRIGLNCSLAEFMG